MASENHGQHDLARCFECLMAKYSVFRTPKVPLVLIRPSRAAAVFRASVKLLRFFA
jgi:hypothetical protein